MLPGQIYSESGDILEFFIEKAPRSGGVTAYNPKTNESFNGRYVGILQEITSSSVGFASTGRSSAFVLGDSSLSSNIGNTTAYLKGDKGTMLTCKMQIEVGFSPHGIGTCEDQKLKPFRLQF